MRSNTFEGVYEVVNIRHTRNAGALVPLQHAVPSPALSRKTPIIAGKPLVMNRPVDFTLNELKEFCDDLHALWGAGSVVIRDKQTGLPIDFGRFYQVHSPFLHRVPGETLIEKEDREFLEHVEKCTKIDPIRSHPEKGIGLPISVFTPQDIRFNEPPAESQMNVAANTPPVLKEEPAQESAGSVPPPPDPEPEETPAEESALSHLIEANDIPDLQKIEEEFTPAPMEIPVSKIIEDTQDLEPTEETPGEVPVEISEEELAEEGPEEVAVEEPEEGSDAELPKEEQTDEETTENLLADLSNTAPPPPPPLEVPEVPKKQTRKRKTSKKSDT